jgi:hypothetical protein
MQQLSEQCHRLLQPRFSPSLLQYVHPCRHLLPLLMQQVQRWQVQPKRQGMAEEASVHHQRFPEPPWQLQSWLS